MKIRLYLILDLIQVQPVVKTGGFESSLVWSWSFQSLPSWLRAWTWLGPITIIPKPAWPDKAKNVSYGNLLHLILPLATHLIMNPLLNLSAPRDLLALRNNQFTKIFEIVNLVFEESIDTIWYTGSRDSHTCWVEFGDWIHLHWYHIVSLDANGF